MGFRKQSKGIRGLFTELGYTPREIFNAMQGSKRLIFNDVEHGRRIDIFLDVFEMCHKFDFKDRLTLDKLTIPLADLLATKLQVVEITDREYKDIMALMHDHELADTDASETINVSYLADLCAGDWGIYKTFITTIQNVLLALNTSELPKEDQAIIKKRLEQLQSRIESIPKSMGWKVRAKIGEKKQWYELPERDKEVVDSRIYGTNKETK